MDEFVLFFFLFILGDYLDIIEIYDDYIREKLIMIVVFMIIDKCYFFVKI